MRISRRKSRADDILRDLRGSCYVNKESRIVLGFSKEGTNIISRSSKEGKTYPRRILQHVGYEALGDNPSLKRFLRLLAPLDNTGARASPELVDVMMYVARVQTAHGKVKEAPRYEISPLCVAWSFLIEN
ncbi:protein CHROMATIN REMODELING 8 [Dorcoceras hygrometricum]|uniref:Protein CHROMATIN REMODELING 8 n=1 Tax=Dorcoceras hygrometricum TaxID=472368 RepID=A0A2Z7CCY6_9LAMI|nr:protein CHROMATIN REMODELING 8 [Dorcoceras hygrometricum]